MVATLKPIEGLHDGTDEQAAQAVEARLLDLGTELAEARNVVAWLKGALDEGSPAALLERIEADLRETESHLPRLMCEARKELRGE